MSLDNGIFTLADVTVTNLVTNGNFVSTNGWSLYTSGSMALGTNSLTIAGAGSGAGNRTITGVRTSIGAKIPGHKYYMKAYVTVNNANCASISIKSGADTAKVWPSPTSGYKYIINDVFTATTNSANMDIEYKTKNAYVATTDNMKIEYVNCVDLTAAFGAGNEPTSVEMEIIVLSQANEWINGSFIVIGRETMLTPYVNVTRESDAIKIENRLLDGTYHVQTIGNTATFYKVVLYAINEATRYKVDMASASGQELYIRIDGVVLASGLIRGNLSWTKTAGTFSTEFDFLVV